jgi:hypothetical protein
MNERTVFWAYLTAPLGAVVLLAILAFMGFVINPGPNPLETALGVTSGFIVMAVIISYVSGLFLLPVLLLFEIVGWCGWRYYVPTAAVGGLVAALVMAYPEPLSSPWTYYVLFSSSGASCAVVFSIVLGWRSNTQLHPTAAAMKTP